MAATIKVKYALGDEVWFMDRNFPARAAVEIIRISTRDTQYFCGGEWRYESNIFPSREALRDRLFKN